MPLSEEELRLLEQMERALVEEDPKFASTLRGTSFRRAVRRKAILAGVVFVVGITVLMTGAIMQLIPVGIIGFVVMLASATYGLTVWRGQSAPQAAAAPQETKHEGFSVIDGGRAGRKPRKQRHQASGSFMERMEERWRHRRDQNGGL
ncbi:MAG: DUF3040 domain-containing protein [Nocardioides sp.]|nr:DUF3040 domain-containing protein [Nocardioides sp.]